MNKRYISSVMRCLLFLALFLFTAPVVIAHADEPNITEDGFEYIENYDSNIGIINYHGTEVDITTPKKIGGKVVKSIVIKDNDIIKSLTISEGMDVIPSNAFQNCSNLEKVTIPASVTRIDTNPFSSCKSLVEITVATKNKKYYAKDGVLMEKVSKGSSIVSYPGGKKGAYTIPKEVIYIGEQSFYGASGLTKITIPKTVQAISANAFTNCTSLKTVDIKKGELKYLWWKAFAGCTSLTSVSIPSSLNNITDGVFAGCTKLKTLNIDKNHPTFKMIDGALYNVYPNKNMRLCLVLANPTLKKGTFTVPKKTIEVNSGAFDSISKITTIDFSKSDVTYFSAYQFMGWEGTVIIKKNSALAKSIISPDSYYGIKFKYVK